MFVDDSSVIRKVAKRILGSPEMLVIEAGSGLEAFEMCLADIIQRVRAIETPINPQVILCLMEVDIGAIMRAKRAGAQGYLLKPFNRSQLLERFRQLQAA